MLIDSSYAFFGLGWQQLWLLSSLPKGRVWLMSHMFMTATTTARGEVRTSHSGLPASRALVRTWTRIIAGVPYGFTAVIMPSGERRYFISRYNGYCADAVAAGTADLTTVLAFGCAWSPVHAIIVDA